MLGEHMEQVKQGGKRVLNEGLVIYEEANEKQLLTDNKVDNGC